MRKNCKVIQLEPTKESIKELYDLLGVSYDDLARECKYITKLNYMTVDCIADDVLWMYDYLVKYDDGTAETYDEVELGVLISQGKIVC